MITADDGNGKTVRIEHLEQGLGEIKELLRDHTREEKQAWQKWWDRLDSIEATFMKYAINAEGRFTALETHQRDIDNDLRGLKKTNDRMTNIIRIAVGGLVTMGAAIAAIAQGLLGGKGGQP